MSCAGNYFRWLSLILIKARQKDFVRQTRLSSGYVENAVKDLGRDMQIASMIRYEVSEEFEKKKKNFAAEVAAQMANK